MKQTIKIADVVNDSVWVAIADGRKVYDVVRPLLLSGTQVELSFEGKQVVVTPFISAAVGDLYREKTGIGNVDSLLSYVGKDEEVDEKLNRVISNAKRPTKELSAYGDILDREVQT